MGLQQKIDQDLIQALKLQDKIKSSTLRMLKSAIITMQKQGKEELTENEIVKIISKEIAQRKEAAKMFEKAGRKEKADLENQELQLLQNYMPEQLSDEDLHKVIDGVIVETKASGTADIGKVMKEVMSKVSGKAEGSQVNQLVRQKLNN
ncbi:MAG: GatB/YqeY domain-containing protein [bacterium]